MAAAAFDPPDRRFIDHVRLQLPATCCLADIGSLIAAVYPDLAHLATTNALADEINDACLAELPGDVQELISVVTLETDEANADGGTTGMEVIHAANPGGLPPHRL